jgi:hypothetical protein
MDHHPIRARHPMRAAVYCVMAAPSGMLDCDQKALSESHQVIRRPLARLPPCFAVWTLFDSLIGFCPALVVTARCG